MKRFRGILAGTVAVSTLLAGTPATTAADLDLKADSEVMRFILPMVPLAFDFAVQGGRSLAEISYGERRYDPITETFVVSDLHIRRDALDLTIGRLRLGESALSLDGLAFDTRNIWLDPPLREGLKRLGRETVNGSLSVGLRRDDARSAYAVDLAVDLEQIAALSVSGIVDNFHFLVPLSDVVGGEAYSEEPKISGALVGAEATYRDRGLMLAVAATAAKEQGVSPEEMLNGFAVMPTMTLPQILAELPGGASPAFTEKAMGWARTVEGFMRKPDVLRVRLDPAAPVALERLQAGVIDEALVTDLNANVVAGAAADRPSLPETAAPGSLAAAAALASGNGVPQDREAAATALLALAASGDVEAVQRIATLFGSGAPPRLTAEDRARLYSFMLVGKALGGKVSQAALDAVGKDMAPDGIRAAEIAATAYFTARTPQGAESRRLTRETATGTTAGRLRSLAYDFYEGTQVPRDLTEAYALSLVAAAAGDPQATSLRDHLARAVGDGRVAIAMADAKARAADLWAGYAAALK